MEISDKIKFLRKQKGLTLEQIGDYVGVGKSTVRKWENGIIENIRRDKIAKLAFILGTTPDDLLGWKNEQDEWYTSFCEYLSSDLFNRDIDDAISGEINIKRLQAISNGEIPLSFNEACSIADELGLSLDEMVGLNASTPEKINDGSDEFTDLFFRLTPNQQSLIISQIKGILANQKEGDNNGND